MTWRIRAAVSAWALAFPSIILPAIPATGYSTYLGGGGSTYQEDQAAAVAVDSSGRAFVAGTTSSETFPATRIYGNDNFGSFVCRLNPEGSALEFSTLLRGIEARGMAVSPGGEIFLVAQSYGGNVPYLDATQFAGGYTDAVLVKLSPDGALIFARYVGGSDLELPRAIALDPNGHVVIAGLTTSTNFPVSPNAFQPRLAGGFDGFVAKFNPAGERLAGSYFGGSSSESIFSIAIDSSARVCLTGTTPVPLASLGTEHRLGPGGGRDAYIARFTSNLAAVDFVSRIGGSDSEVGAALALDPAGAIVLFGQTLSRDFPVSGALQPNPGGESDHFIAKFSPEGERLIWSTFLGGAFNEDILDYQYVGEYTVDGIVRRDEPVYTASAGLAVDPSGSIYIGARTTSWSWPAVQTFSPSFGGDTDSYFAKVSADGSRLLDFRFLGGASYDLVRTIALDSDRNVYLAGMTERPLRVPFFVATPGGAQPVYGGNVSDAILLKLAAINEPSRNDAFASRLELKGTRCGGQAEISSASIEPGEPILGGAAKTLWWTWKAPASGRARVTTAGSAFDTVLAAFSGESLDGLTRQDWNDDENAESQQSAIRFPVTAGVSYHIQVGGKAGASGPARVSLAFSQPPNDDLASAATLNGFPAFAAGTNTNGTIEPGEPDHAGIQASQSVWWKWTAPSSENVMISTLGSAFNTVLAVYTGSKIDALTEVKSNDNATDTTWTSELSFQAQAGQVYHIAVDGPYDASGPIQLSVLPNQPPPNDNFDARTPLSGYRTNLTATNIRSTREPGEPELVFTNALGGIDSNYSRNTVWWSWTAPATGRVRLDTIGSTFDTRLGIYSGTALSNLTLIASHNDIDRDRLNLASRLEFDSTAGTAYAIVVDGAVDSHSGIIQLNLRLSFPPRILASTLKRESSGSMRFEIEGVPEQRYRVETSRDLLHWTGLEETRLSTARGEVLVSSPGSDRAFIRLAELAEN